MRGLEPRAGFGGPYCEESGRSSFCENLNNFEFFLQKTGTSLPPLKGGRLVLTKR